MADAPTTPNSATSHASGAANSTPQSAPNAGGAASPPAQASTPPPAEVSSDWRSSFKNAELKAYVETKGFKDPEMLADSYRNFEKLKGVPQDRLLTLPEKEDAPEWTDVYSRLGKPATAAEYKMDVPADKPEMAEYAKGVKETFYKANLTSKQAEAVMEGFKAVEAAALAKQQAALDAIGAQNETELKTKWGNAFEQNKNIATAGAKQFGVDAPTMAAIEKSLGTVKTMEFFHKVGSSLGEAKFVQGQPMNAGHQTPEAAKMEIKTLQKDKSFTDKLFSGDSSARAKWDKLHADAFQGTISV